jgi:hypothetical protein
MKSQYRAWNWQQYNETLVNRGSGTFWFDEEMIEMGHEQGRTGHRGRPRTCSDVAIACGLTPAGSIPLATARGGRLFAFVDRAKAVLAVNSCALALRAYRAIPECRIANAMIAAGILLKPTSHELPRPTGLP